MSVLERCPSYRESNKGSKERQGPTLGVRFTEVSACLTEVSVKGESTVYSFLAFKTSVSCNSIFFSAFCSYLELLLLYKEPLNDNN